MGNPILEICVQPIIRTVTTVGFQPATRKHQEVLKFRLSSIVAVIDITYYHEDMPHKVLDKGNVDLEDA